MKKIDFKNYPDESTPLSAENLNQLQTNIEEAINEVNDNLTVGSGWIDLEFSSNFGNYKGIASNNPKYRKIGNVVMLQGVATPVEKTPADSTQVELFTLPEEARPSKVFYQLCQGSGVNQWLLTVDPTGAVTFSRYGTTNWVSSNPENWLPFNIVYFID